MGYGGICGSFRKQTPARSEMAYQYTAIIPTLNASSEIDALIDRLGKQTLPPREIIVVDSHSDDDTARRAASHAGTRVIGIRREEFDHGGTRDMAIRACDTPFVVLLTQDALPMDAGCMAALLAPFGDDRVAAVCGRQVARDDARPSERAVRAFRYPDGSRTWGGEDIPRLGMSAYLLSDVCAAYRRSSYEAVGGFVHPIATNEDMLIAADLLDAGYRLAYAAEARVWHSHNFSPAREYRRNRLIGCFLARYGHRFGDAGELGEGMRMVKSVSSRLLKEGHILNWMAFGVNCGARFLGNRAGRRHANVAMKGVGSHE